MVHHVVLIMDQDMINDIHPSLMIMDLDQEEEDFLEAHHEIQHIMMDHMAHNMAHHMVHLMDLLMGLLMVHLMVLNMVQCMVQAMVLHMGLHMGHLLVIMAIMEVLTMVPGRMVQEDKIMETMVTVTEEETIKVISEVEEAVEDLNKTGKRIPVEETKISLQKAFPPSGVVYHVLIIFSRAVMLT